MGEVKIDGLDMVDVIDFVGNKKNKFIAIMLDDVEMKFTANSEEHKFMRKVILDGMNDYTRSLLRIFFGDIEGLIMK